MMPELEELDVGEGVHPARATKRVTIKDIALRAGVKHPSVSVVLNDAKSGTHVSDETRQRILQAAAELGYRPNSSARAMKTGRFGSVALLTSSEKKKSTVQSDFQDGIHDELAANDLHLMLLQAPDSLLTDEAAVPRLLREWMVDGLLLGYNVCAPPQMAEIIERYRIPSIWINAERDLDCVRPDDEAGTYQATRHLLQLGHRRIAYVSIARPIHYSVAARERGYRKAMQEAGYTSQVFEEDLELPGREKFAMVQSWLAQPTRPTAMLFYGGESPVLTFYAAEKLGIDVPQQLSLITVGQALLSCLYATMDTLVIPFHEIGRLAVRQLLAKIENPAHVSPACLVPLSLAPGETCAPAPPDSK